MKEYPPYFIYPDVMALRENPSREDASRLRRRIAANVGDIPSLRLMLGLDPDEFARFYPDMIPANLSTDATIDSFLEKFGRPDASVPKAAVEIGTDSIPVIGASPAQDNPADSTSSAIDSFLSSIPAQRKKKAPGSPSGSVQSPPPETAKTEEDARKLIKNHDYQTALEIIMRLSLNNPEKSIYFADQIRFLRKLILIQNKQKQ